MKLEVSLQLDGWAYDRWLINVNLVGGKPMSTSCSDVWKRSNLQGHDFFPTEFLNVTIKRHRICVI